MYRVKELEKELKKKEKELADEKEKVEILKNPCTSLCNHENEMQSYICPQRRTLREKDVQSIGAVRKVVLSVAERRKGQQKRQKAIA